MNSNTTTLLPGQSAPLATITAIDQSGIVLITTALALAISLTSLLMRVYMQLQIRHQFSQDDYLTMSSMVVSLLQSITVFIQVSKGFGKTISDVSPTNLVPLQKAAYSSELLYIMILWLTKCSVALLLLRLSPQREHNLVSYGILASSTVLMIVSVFMVALRCDMAEPWIFINSQCTNLLVRWEVETVFDITTELALFAASIHLVKGLQLSLSKKMTVIFAFGLRLGVIAPALLRLFYLNQEFTSSDPTLHGVIASVCSQIQISYAIVAATIPCLRPFMAALSTNYGAPAQNRTSPSGTKKSQQYKLSSLSKSTRSIRVDRSKLSAPVKPWDRGNTHTSVVSGDQHSMESHESKQMIISKNTEWQVDFEGPSQRFAQP
ncbi:hypothetical protein N431DRAFT_349139 [Stipitochalara longipes BDJ]|nr:hypothetical protein N431DRAFT_349139 [Stipitochalara longipes BDJ]